MGTAERLAIAAAVVLLPACSQLTTRIGTPVAMEALPRARAPIPLADVLDALGAPDRVGAAPEGGFFLSYESIEVRERQVGLSLPGPWLRYFKLTFGRARVERRQLVLHFDRHGRVQARGGVGGESELGRGVGVQLLVSVVPTVDLEGFETSPGQVRWGRELLARLPEALNRDADLESGASGLEQRATPARAGQHSLEMRASRSIWRRAP